MKYTHAENWIVYLYEMGLNYYREYFPPKLFMFKTHCCPSGGGGGAELSQYPMKTRKLPFFKKNVVNYVLLKKSLQCYKFLVFSQDYKF